MNQFGDSVFNLQACIDLKKKEGISIFIIKKFNSPGGLVADAFCEIPSRFLEGFQSFWTHTNRWCFLENFLIPTLG